jgi:hypothetical protein
LPLHGELCNLDILFNHLIHLEIPTCAIFCILKKKAAMYQSHSAMCSLSQLSVPFICRPLLDQHGARTQTIRFRSLLSLQCTRLCPNMVPIGCLWGFASRVNTRVINRQLTRHGCERHQCQRGGSILRGRMRHKISAQHSRHIVPHRLKPSWHQEDVQDAITNYHVTTRCLIKCSRSWRLMV